MDDTEKDNKSKAYRESQKIKFQQPEDYSAPSNEQAKKHIKIMSGFRPNSEIPGNDR